MSLCLQDLIDSDALLDADDFKKPDPASLKAPTCGEGAKKKKKACKNWYEKCIPKLSKFEISNFRFYFTPETCQTHMTYCPFYLTSTCGLAEELDQESKGAQKASQPKSACGSVSFMGYTPKYRVIGRGHRHSFFLFWVCAELQWL